MIAVITAIVFLLSVLFVVAGLLVIAIAIWGDAKTLIAPAVVLIIFGFVVATPIQPNDDYRLRRGR